MKFRAGESIWVLSDGGAAPVGVFAATVVGFKETQFIDGQWLEFYYVHVPRFRGTCWVAAHPHMRSRQADPKDPPGLTDEDPGKPTTWDRCEWQPGKQLDKKNIP
jgi:hypothetical protein